MFNGTYSTHSTCNCEADAPKRLHLELPALSNVQFRLKQTADWLSLAFCAAPCFVLASAPDLFWECTCSSIIIIFFFKSPKSGNVFWFFSTFLRIVKLKELKFIRNGLVRKCSFPWNNSGNSVLCCFSRVYKIIAACGRSQFCHFNFVILNELSRSRLFC